MTGFSAVPITDEPEDGQRWAGVARIVGPSWTQLPSLTVGLLGVQMLWSVEMSYGSPYLLSLGLSKSLMAIVFLAGPLSGLIVQPVIGVLADNSKSRFGRRRPIIIVCASLCALATLLLGFTRPFASIFTPLNSVSNDVLTIWLAVASIYFIDFSINAVQALDRALLVDILPTAKQPAGNAWAARMVTIGGMAGFFAGNLDLPHLFPFLGSTQLQALSLIAALLLFSTQAWMCFHVKERVLLRSSSHSTGLRQEAMKLWDTFVRLPSVIRQICWIQFFSSLGWFPVLFYATVYIGDLHKRSLPIPESEDAAIALDEESTRLGSRAFLYSSLVSLAANIIMPSFVVSQRAGHASSPLQPKQKSWLERVRMHLASLWAYSHLIFAMCMAATFVTSTVSGATWIISVTGFCWAVGLWVPFALLGEAILSHPASDDAGSIHLVDTRSTRMFYPRDDVEHNMNDEETQQLFHADMDNDDDDDDDENKHENEPKVVRGDSAGSCVSRTTSSSFDYPENDEPDPRPRIIGLGAARARVSRIDLAAPPPSPPAVAAHSEGNAVTTLTSGSAKGPGGGLSAQAGAIIGILNIFCVIPQFLVTGLSSIIFALLDPDKSAVLHAHDASTRPNATVIIFQIGGVAAVIAFVLTYRLAKELKRQHG